MEGFEQKIVRTSRELTARERICLKNNQDAISLGTLTDASEPIKINVDMWAEILVHNEHSEDKEYTNYVVVDKDGTKYYTGSTSFWEGFIDIYNEMVDAGEEEIVIKVLAKASTKRAGKYFLTCNLA